MATAADSVNGVVSDFATWAKTPFTSTMGIGGWFLFFGLILAISIAWGIILHDLKGEL